MTTVRKLVISKKSIVECGKWANAGTRGMPKSAFPLSRTRSFVLGKKWRWRVDRLGVDEAELRLLTAFEPSTEKFLAWLSLRRGDSFALIARYEFHGDEPGWHAHSQCDDVRLIPVGVVKPYGTKRIPGARRLHRRVAYEVTEANALAISYRVFRVDDVPEDGFL